MDMNRQIISCRHLELRSREKDRGIVESYICEIKQDDTTAEEREEYILGLFGEGMPCGRYYEPYCKKKDSVCVVIESPVMSQQHTGGMYQPITITIANSTRIKECEDRDFPEDSHDGTEPLDNLLLKHLQKSNK